MEKQKPKVPLRPVISEPVGEHFRQYCRENYFSLNTAVTLAVKDWLKKQKELDLRQEVSKAS